MFNHSDHSDMKLGKAPVKHDDRTLKLVNYLTALPTPPSKCNWAKGVKSFPVYGNDTLGDCTVAAAGHMDQVWSEQGKPYYEPRASALIAIYMALSPGDEGCYELDVLNYWRKKGIPSTEHKITAYAGIKPKNVNTVKLAINLFGSVYSGIALPFSAQNQKVWKVVSGSNAAAGSWGGHAVPLVAYDSKYVTCVTWGKLLKMTWAFWQAYADEAYAVLDQSWFGADRVSPAGFDFASLKSDLRAL